MKVFLFITFFIIGGEFLARAENLSRPNLKDLDPKLNPYGTNQSRVLGDDGHYRGPQSVQNDMVKIQEEKSNLEIRNNKLRETSERLLDLRERK